MNEHNLKYLSSPFFPNGTLGYWLPWEWTDSACPYLTQMAETKKVTLFFELLEFDKECKSFLS